MNIGLLSVTASVYQMMRGAEMLFAALFAVMFLKRHLNKHHYMGIMCCAVSRVVQMQRSCCLKDTCSRLLCLVCSLPGTSSCCCKSSDFAALTALDTTVEAATFTAVSTGWYLHGWPVQCSEWRRQLHTRGVN